jgi:serine/threonine protein kinase
MSFLENYEIYGLLGSGNFGAVYKGINRNTQGLVAIKIDSHDSPLLEREVFFYETIWKRIITESIQSLYIPAFYWTGIEKDKRILVTERLGISLDKLYDRYNRNWSEETLYWITVQGLVLLRDLHRIGILHRDIKPDNFAIGYNNREQLYIFDFGLAAKYVDDAGEHWEFNNGYGIIGTSRYASVATHLGFRQSRKDDLESFFYMMYYLWNKTLPWLNSSPEDSDKNAFILKIKRTHHWEKSTIPDVFKEFIAYVKTLKFKEQPVYDYWIDRFKRQCRSAPDWIFDMVEVRSIAKTKKHATTCT